MPLAAGEISSKNAPVSAGMRGVPRLKGPAARAREGQLPMLPAPAVAAAKASKNSRLVKPLIGFCFSCEVCSVSVAFLLAVWAFRCFVRQASRRRGRTVAHHTRPMAYGSVARDDQPSVQWGRKARALRYSPTASASRFSSLAWAACSARFLNSRALDGLVSAIAATEKIDIVASRNSLRAVKQEPAMAVSAERIAEASKKYLYKKEKLSTGTCYVSTVDSFPGW